MVKRFVISMVVLLSAQRAIAEEKNLYHCTSEVLGFTDFTISQISDVSEVATPNKLALQVGLELPEIWDQYGEAKLWDGTQIFESQFVKPSLNPSFPASRIYVSINENGTGALSANSGLDPINCQKLF